MDIVIVANKNCYKEKPSFLQKENLFYYYSKDIKNVADARNFIFNNLDLKNIDFFGGHDIDDTFLSRHSLSQIIQPLLQDSNLILSFGKSKIIGDKKLFRELYPSFISQNNLSNNIITCKNYLKKTFFFPTQATLYDYNIVKNIGGYPNYPSMEDRLLILNILNYAEKHHYPINFCNKDIIKYTIHKQSLSCINGKNGIRESIQKNILSNY